MSASVVLKIRQMRDLDVAGLLVAHTCHIDDLLAAGNEAAAERGLAEWRSAIDSDDACYGDVDTSRWTRCLNLVFRFPQLQEADAFPVFSRACREWLAYPLRRLGDAIDLGRTHEIETWRWAGAAYGALLYSFLHREHCAEVAESRLGSSVRRVPLSDRLRKQYGVARRVRIFRMDRAKRISMPRRRLWNLLRAERAARFMVEDDAQRQSLFRRAAKLEQQAREIVAPDVLYLLPGTASVEQRILFYEHAIAQVLSRTSTADDGVHRRLSELLAQCDILSAGVLSSHRDSREPGATDSSSPRRDPKGGNQLVLPGMPPKNGQFQIPGLLPDEE